MERIETITTVRELNISIIDDVITRYGFDAAKSAWQAIRSEIMECVREHAHNSDYTQCPKCGGGVIYTNDEQTRRSCCHCNHEWHCA